MGSDDLFKKRKGNKKQRKETNIKMAPHRYLIMCEGQTEKNYFEGIKNRINIRFPGSIKVEENIFFEIEGTGRNTESLVEYTMKYVNRSPNPYSQIWVIFDKDDNSDQSFNNAISMAQNYGFNVGWSNECFELWFLLYFEYLNTGINRERYYEKISEYFKKLNINGGKYEKNIDDIFELLMMHGDLKQAIEFAKKLIHWHKSMGNENSEAKMIPATTVFELVESLIHYFI